MSNMAMTACFAGPGMFSLSVGLGVGFLLLLNSQGAASVPVNLSAVDTSSIAFILANTGALVRVPGSNISISTACSDCPDASGAR